MHAKRESMAMPAIIRLAARYAAAAAIALTTGISILLFYGPTDNWRWDPSYYYAQMRSPIIDRDLDFRAETVPQSTAHTATGLQPSVWPVGPGIVWSPFFIAADVAVHLFGPSKLADGMSWPYIAAVSAGAALYGLLGIVVIYRICRLFAGHGASLVASLLVLLATPLFFYVYRQPLMAHSASLLASALLVYLVIAIDRDQIDFKYSGLLGGSLFGLNVLLRWISISAVTLSGIMFICYLIEAIQLHDRGRIRQVLLQMLIATITAIVVVSPQLAFWHVIYGSWIGVSIGGFSSSLLPQHFFDLFVHTNRGIVYWLPFACIGLIGLYKVRPIRLLVAFLVYLSLYFYILGSWEVWYSGGGFGARYFIEILPLAAIGYALLIQPLWQRGLGRIAIVATATLLVLHQYMLLMVVEQSWLPLKAYGDGGEIGLSYQLDGMIRMFAQPGSFFLPRPAVGVDRQTALVSYLSGASDLQLYVLPLVAAVLIPLGLALFQVFASRRWLLPGALLLIVWSLGWFGFLLII